MVDYVVTDESLMVDPLPENWKEIVARMNMEIEEELSKRPDAELIREGVPPHAGNFWSWIDEKLDWWRKAYQSEMK